MTADEKRAVDAVRNAATAETPNYGNGGATVPWYYVHEFLLRKEREAKRDGDHERFHRMRALSEELSTFDAAAWSAQTEFEELHGGK